MTGSLLIYHFLFSAPASPKAGALLDLCAERAAPQWRVPSRAGADSHINIPPGGILLCILICLLKSAFFSPTERSCPAAVFLWRLLNQISISALQTPLKHGKNLPQLRVSIENVKIDFSGEPAQQSNKQGDIFL